jgi:hypothetical protein
MIFVLLLLGIVFLEESKTCDGKPLNLKTPYQYENYIVKMDFTTLENISLEKIAPGQIKMTFKGELSFTYEDEVYFVKEIIIFGKSIH